jgi:hypothetical protein
MRPRLRLTPTATDAEFSAVFDAAGGKAPPAPSAAGRGRGRLDPGRTCSETSTRPPRPATSALAERLAGEIGAMGIDPPPSCPRPASRRSPPRSRPATRPGARAVVKSLAPAAIRRLVRRLFSDNGLRDDAERFRRRYGGMIDEAAEQDRERLPGLGPAGPARPAAPTCCSTPRPATWPDDPMKRLFDLAVSGLALAAAGPAAAGRRRSGARHLAGAGDLLVAARRPVNNRLFAMPKFRTMRIDTPEVATHLLASPDRWLTPIGSFAAPHQPRRAAAAVERLSGRHEPGRPAPGPAQPGRSDRHAHHRRRAQPEDPASPAGPRSTAATRSPSRRRWRSTRNTCGDRGSGST